jgi:hypothetical protein
MKTRGFLLSKTQIRSVPIRVYPRLKILSHMLISHLDLMRKLVESLDERFALLHGRSREFIRLIPPDKIYSKPPVTQVKEPAYSCGEYLLRSAGAVEQACNGVTTKMWDDPFEWTLPETLSTSEKILEYLAEVEETRGRAFGLFVSDADLQREIPAPEKLKTIFALLLETLSRAEHYQGRAFALFRLFSDSKLPRI